MDMTTHFPSASAGSYSSFDRIDFIISKWPYAKLIPFIYFSTSWAEKYHSRFHAVEVAKDQLDCRIYIESRSPSVLKEVLCLNLSNSHKVLLAVLTCFLVFPSTTLCCSPSFSNGPVL